MTATDDTDLVDLDEIEPDEELVGEMRKARITTPLTRALIGVVIVAAAFLAGAYVHRWQHPASASSGVNPRDLIAQFRNGAGGQGANGGTGTGRGTGLGGGGGATIGTVKLVDGSTVYVEDASGNVTRVTTDDTTKVTVSKEAKVTELAPGTSVIVQGAQGDDGASVEATSISESAGLGGGGFPGVGGGVPNLPANGNGG